MVRRGVTRRALALAAVYRAAAGFAAFLRDLHAGAAP